MGLLCFLNQFITKEFTVFIALKQFLSLVVFSPVVFSLKKLFSWFVENKHVLQLIAEEEVHWAELGFFSPSEHWELIPVQLPFLQSLIIILFSATNGPCKGSARLLQQHNQNSHTSIVCIQFYTNPPLKGL